MTAINENPTALESHLIEAFGDEESFYSEESLDQLQLLADPRVFAYLRSLDSGGEGSISSETFKSILTLEDGNIEGIEGVELIQLQTAAGYLLGNEELFDEIAGGDEAISLEELEAFIWQGQSISAAVQEGNSVHDFYQAVKILVDSGLLDNLGEGELESSLRGLAGDNHTLNAAIDVIFSYENEYFRSQVAGEDGVLTADDFVNWKTDFENGLYIDGIIDPDGSQVKDGALNCVLHATIQAISNQNPAALASLVTIDGDGNYVVAFPGDPDRTITVYQENLSEASLNKDSDYYGLASGDLDLQVLTIAVEKYANEYGIDSNGDGKPDLTTTKGATRAGAYYELLTGEKAEKTGADDLNIDSLVDEDGNLLAPTLVAMWISSDEDNPNPVLSRDEGNDDVGYKHALAVESVDKENQTIILQDPYDPDHTLTLTFEEFYASALYAVTSDEATEEAENG